VSVHYGRVAAVNDLSLEVNQGEFVGLVGHNGAGKSTTLWTITGVLKPSRGQITFEGRSLLAVARKVDSGEIALVPGTAEYSVGSRWREPAHRHIRRRDRRAAAEDVKKMCERFPVLGSLYDRPGSKLSGGEQQQLAIARALLARPKLLLLDEPTLGLAPLIVDQVFEILQELKEEGVTILLVEQNAARTIEVADRTYVMRSGGRIQFQGTTEELARIGDFETAYIGLAETG
jgi:branched-chain amino acid transport system ATP-binding protein